MEFESKLEFTYAIRFSIAPKQTCRDSINSSPKAVDKFVDKRVWKRNFDDQCIT